MAILHPRDDPFPELADALPNLKPEMSEENRLGFLSSIRKQLAQGVEALRNGITALVPQGCHRLIVRQNAVFGKICLQTKTSKIRKVDGSDELVKV
jgi:hypothetical protein